MNDIYEKEFTSIDIAKSAIAISRHASCKSESFQILFEPQANGKLLVNQWPKIITRLKTYSFLSWPAKHISDISIWAYSELGLVTI